MYTTPPMLWGGSPPGMAPLHVGVAAVAGQPAAALDALCWPVDPATGLLSSLLLVSSSAACIYRCPAQGGPAEVFVGQPHRPGSDDGPEGTATLNDPRQVHPGPNSLLFVVEGDVVAATSRLRVIDPGTRHVVTVRLHFDWGPFVQDLLTPPLVCPDAWSYFSASTHDGSAIIYILWDDLRCVLMVITHSSWWMMERSA